MGVTYLRKPKTEKYYRDLTRSEDPEVAHVGFRRQITLR